MRVWALAYNRFDEGYILGIYKTEEGAQKALDKVGPNVRGYHSIQEFEVKDD